MTVCNQPNRIMQNHMHLQILVDESIVTFNIEMQDGQSPAEVLGGACADNRDLELKDIKIIWFDNEWDQIVFQANGEQYVGSFQIVDYDQL